MPPIKKDALAGDDNNGDHARSEGDEHDDCFLSMHLPLSSDSEVPVSPGSCHRPQANVSSPTDSGCLSCRDGLRAVADYSPVSDARAASASGNGESSIVVSPVAQVGIVCRVKAGEAFGIGGRSQQQQQQQQQQQWQGDMVVGIPQQLVNDDPPVYAPEVGPLVSAGLPVPRSIVGVMKAQENAVDVAVNSSVAASLVLHSETWTGQVATVEAEEDLDKRLAAASVSDVGDLMLEAYPDTSSEEDASMAMQKESDLSDVVSESGAGPSQKAEV